jgi:hypothetical protein
MTEINSDVFSLCQMEGANEIDTPNVLGDRLIVNVKPGRGLVNFNWNRSGTATMCNIGTREVKYLLYSPPTATFLLKSGLGTGESHTIHFPPRVATSNILWYIL